MKPIETLKIFSKLMDFSSFESIFCTNFFTGARGTARWPPPPPYRRSGASRRWPCASSWARPRNRHQWPNADVPGETRWKITQKEHVFHVFWVDWFCKRSVRSGFILFLFFKFIWIWMIGHLKDSFLGADVGNILEPMLLANSSKMAMLSCEKDDKEKPLVNLKGASHADSQP